MNNIINKFFLTGDKFMAEMHLRQMENRLISDQKLRNSAYDIASNPKHDDNHHQRGLASMVYKFFDSKVAPLDKKNMSDKGNAKHTAKPSSLERTEIIKF